MKRIWMVLVVLAAACGETPGGVELEPVTTVTVGPADRMLTVGDTMRVTALPRQADGTIRGGLPVTWSSDSTQVAVVSGTSTSALVRAVAPGRAVIRATVEGKAGEVVVTVQPGPVQVVALEIIPGGGQLVLGVDVQLEAVLRAADGSAIGGRPVTWTSSDNESITVTSFGNPLFATVRGNRPGVAVVRAQADGATGEAVFEVRAAVPVPASIQITAPADTMRPGQTIAVTARALAADGSPIASEINWGTTDARVFTVVRGSSAGSAQVMAHAPGTAVLSAWVGGVRRDLPILVKERPVSQVLVTPRIDGLWEYATQQFTAVAIAHNGAPLHGRTMHWAVEDSTIADVDSAGNVRALRPGVTRVFATAEGKTGSAELRVYRAAEQMTFHLTYDWWDMDFHLARAMGTTQWTDAAGTVHTVTLHAESGTFAVDLQAGTYERVILGRGRAVVNGTPQVVAEQTYTDRGNLYYRWNPWSDNSTTFDFVSTTTPGLAYKGRLRNGGELMVEMPGMGGQLLDTLFRMN